MPVQKTVSKLAQKYGAKLDAAIKSHADDDVDYGFTRVPPGITNGVAKLVDAKFDTYKTGAYQGEYYFRAAAVVVEPTTIMTPSGEVEVRGLQTSVMVPCCATKNQKGEVTSQEDNIAKVLNEMKKLAGADFTKGAGVNELESLAAALKEAGPYTRFSTSQSPATAEFPSPRIWENWNGGKGLENYAPPEDGGVEDATAQANGESRRPGKPAGAKPTAQAAPEPFDEFQGQSTGEGTEEDLDALAARAADEDGDAQTRLHELAAAAGVDEDAVAGAEDWPAVVALIQEARGGGEEPAAEEEEEEAEEPWAGPKKEEVYNYQPRDAKGKPLVDAKTKKARKPVQCEVTAVDKKSKTVTCRNLVDGKSIYKGVRWDDLESGE